MDVVLALPKLTAITPAELAELATNQLLAALATNQLLAALATNQLLAALAINQLLAALAALAASFLAFLPSQSLGDCSGAPQSRASGILQNVMRTPRAILCRSIGPSSSGPNAQVHS
jgi:hypothetical protein